MAGPMATRRSNFSASSCPRRRNSRINRKTEGGNNARSHSASLSALTLLRENPPRARPQGPELAIGRNSSVDAAPKTDADDGRLPAHAYSPDRSRVLLRHAAHPEGDRGFGWQGRALPAGTARHRQGVRLVD